jgi:hypothetical protein
MLPIRRLRARKHPNERGAKTIAWPLVFLMVLFGMATVGLLYYRELTSPVGSVQEGPRLSARLVVADEKEFHIILTNRSDYPVVASVYAWYYEIKLFDGCGNELTNQTAYCDNLNMAGPQSKHYRLLKPGEECTVVTRAFKEGGWMPIPKEAVRGVAQSFEGGPPGFLTANVSSHFGAPMAFLKEKPSVRLRRALW